MGGRGSYSVSGASGGGKIRLLGRNTNVHMKNVGGAAESREGINTLAGQAGFISVSGLDDVGTQSLGAYISAIGKLEKEYGALASTPTILTGADGKSFYAAAGEFNGGAAMVLNRKYMSNAAKHAKAEGAESSKGFKMPTDGKLTSNATYTVKHEYGHLLQFALYRKAAANGYTGTVNQHAADVYKQVKQTAIKKYGATASSLSGYGKSNASEAFAEAFAGLHSGKPTAFSYALRDYLKSNKL